tara:strand:+ start:15494 stop:16465 length:972 start_codon:yes stop_codon:yes gene_type:complete
MTNFRESLHLRASKLYKTIVFPEGSEKRVFKAASKLNNQGIARVILLGGQYELRLMADDLGISLKNIEIITPEKSDLFKSFKETTERILSNKKDDIDNALKSPECFGAYMVHVGKADGCVCGSVTSTPNTIRAAIRYIGLDDSTDLVSSTFLLLSPKGDKLFTFADCGVVPDPNEEQLVTIALDSSRTHKKLTNEKPVVAFLSFSTKGSAAHKSLDKIISASSRFAKLYPDIPSDGEIQFDSAVIEEISLQKAPNSSVKGDANVLIFPDLNAGNIGYKIAQRLGNYSAWGPLLQGLRKPMMDLSRGCTLDDIVDVTSICSLMS